MKLPVEMIAFDLDGTLLNSRKEITPRTRSALAAAHRAGIHIVPATGRQLPGIPPAVLALEGVAYAVSGNGARVVALPDRVLYTDSFRLPEALALLRQARRYPCFISAYLGPMGVMEGDDVEAARPYMSPEIFEYFRSSRVLCPDLETVFRASECPVDKFALNFTDGQARAEAMADFEAMGITTVSSSMALNVELNTITANKGAGLGVLAAELGLPMEKVMAFGDSTNDLHMLRAAGIGVAMGNALAEVKDAADRVAPTCDEDGVAATVEALLAGRFF